jgi:hypothetical protein
MAKTGLEKEGTKSVVVVFVEFGMVGGREKLQW